MKRIFRSVPFTVTVRNHNITWSNFFKELIEDLISIVYLTLHTAIPPTYNILVIRKVLSEKVGMHMLKVRFHTYRKGITSADWLSTSVACSLDPLFSTNRLNREEVPNSGITHCPLSGIRFLHYFGFRGFHKTKVLSLSYIFLIWVRRGDNDHLLCLGVRVVLGSWEGNISFAHLILAFSILEMKKFKNSYQILDLHCFLEAHALDRSDCVFIAFTGTVNAT